MGLLGNMNTIVEDTTSSIINTKQLMDSQGITTPFVTKTVLASLIAGLSLVSNSQEGVIGSMLVSPVGGPIITLVTAFLTNNFTGMKNSILQFSLASVIMFSTGVAIGKIFEDEEPTHEMKRRYSKPNKYTVYTAIIIGACLYFATQTKDGSIGESIGAGIAISLLPPIVNGGLTLMKKQYDPEKLTDEEKELVSKQQYIGLTKDDKRDNIIYSLSISAYNILGIVIAGLLLNQFNKSGSLVSLGF